MPNSESAVFYPVSGFQVPPSNVLWEGVLDTGGLMCRYGKRSTYVYYIHTRHVLGALHRSEIALGAIICLEADFLLPILSNSRKYVVLKPVMPRHSALP